MPAAPVAVVLAVSQATTMLSRLSEPALQYATAEEVSIEQQFLSSIEFLATKPIQAMPVSGEIVTVDTLRAVSQWEIYLQLVARLAQNYGIPLERAFELAKIPASLLPVS